MNPNELSKYAENQPLNATARRFPLMSELVADTLARATSVTTGIAAFTPVIGNLTSAADAWQAGERRIINAEAVQMGATQLFENQMDSLTRRPDSESNSIMERWDNLIRGEVPYQSAVYLTLLPQGRETLTTGTRDEQLTAIQSFAERLDAQTSHPGLVSLAVEVAAFHDTAADLRNAQTQAKSSLDTARQAQEALRVAAAHAIYALLGQGMVTWCTDSSRVDTLWDVNILRNPPQDVPAPPADTTWDAPARTLSTTALPAGATRVEAWRISPGGMPELLATSPMNTTAVIIPATITFTPGGLYQLWLVALNSKGSSTPGPVQNWTAA